MDPRTSKPWARGLGLAVAMMAAAASHAAPDPIRIGVVLSTTGPGAATGIPDRNGVLLAQKTINAAGGVQGRPIELVFEDDTSSPDVAISKANKLIHTEKVQAIIGPNLLGNTVAAGGVTDRSGVPLISLTGINQAAEGSRKCVLHMLPAQELNARGLLVYASKALGAKNVAVLHDTGYGQVIMNALRQAAPEYGVQFSGVEKFEIGATDVTAQAAKLRAGNPDAVIVVSLSAVPFRAVRQVKIAAPVIAANASAMYETVKAMGDAADNIVFAEFLVGEDPLPYQAAFVEAFRKEYGHLPKMFESAAWDAVQLVAHGLREAGANASGSKLCETLRKPYQGAMARFDFSARDQTGLNLGSLIYSKVSDGRFSRLSFRVEP